MSILVLVALTSQAVAQDAPAPTEPPPAPTDPAPAPAPTEPPPAPTDPSSAPAEPPPPAQVEPAPAAAPAPPPPVRLEAPLPPPPPPEDDLPIPTLTLDRVPPNTSYEFAIHVSYGFVPYFRSEVGTWIGFGFRGGYGKNLGLHRLGASGTFAAEGDVGVHTVLGLEPAFAWDFVGNKGLALGAGVGPSFVYGQTNATIDEERRFSVAPTGVIRIGWSQTWSRVGRRLFVFAEPKVRWIDGAVSPVVAVAVGSGGGR